jgi:hypothetical protein
MSKMQSLVAMLFVCMATMAHAANFEMTPAVQAELDKWKTVIAEWAADPTIVKAVAEQNRKGPIPGMEAHYTTVRRCYQRSLPLCESGTMCRGQSERQLFENAWRPCMGGTYEIWCDHSQ